MRIIIFTVVAILLTGCYSSKNLKQNKHNKQQIKPTIEVTNNLNDAIVSIADQLFSSNTDKSKITSVILTSFSDLNQLNKTTTFGRLLSESMFNELHIRKFHVTDFRGQDAVSVNADGEFHLTRDVNKLKDHIEATEYILVGTYVKFENNSVLINSRMIDSVSGSIISTARVTYKPTDCSLFDLCQKTVTLTN